MNYITFQKTKAQKSKPTLNICHYTTFEVYHASALNLFHRGVDGLSLFNYDYVPAKERFAMAEGLKGITDECQRAMLRVETKGSCADLRIAARLNGKRLTPCKHEGTELFPPLVVNSASATRDSLKFYTVPLAKLVHGRNRIEIWNLDKRKTACKLLSIELAIYKHRIPPWRQKTAMTTRDASVLAKESR